MSEKNFIFVVICFVLFASFALDQNKISSYLVKEAATTIACSTTSKDTDSMTEYKELLEAQKKREAELLEQIKQLESKLGKIDENDEISREQDILVSSSNNDTSISKSSFDEIAREIYESSNIKPQDILKRKFNNDTLDNNKGNWTRRDGGLVDADRLLLGKYYYNASSVFEFGLGESTYIAAHVGVPRYTGVDSDATWVAQARSNVENMNVTHFNFHFADIGATRGWGNPIHPDLAKIKYNYQISTLLQSQEAYDIYMVDGRYRVPSACLSFLHALKYRKDDIHNVRVATHDNYRKAYHVVEEIAKVVEDTGCLRIYQLKDDVSESDLKTFYRKWMNSKM